MSMNCSRRFFLIAIPVMALTVASTPYAQTPLFGGFGAPAWSREYAYIQSRFGATAPDDVVVVLPTATNADWGDPNKIVRLLEMKRWVDTEPTRAWQYAPEPGKTISEGFGYFLSAAFLSKVDSDGTATPTLKNAIHRSTEEVEFARADYNQTFSNAAAAYAAYYSNTPPGHRMTKEQFYRDQGWDVQIKSKHDRLEDALVTYKTVAASLVDPDIKLLRAATLKYQDPNQQIMLPPTKEFLNDPDLWESSYISLIGGDIHEFMGDDKPQNEDIDESQHTSDFFEQTWHASVSVSFLGLFRSGGASAEQVKREQHIQDNTTRISISFANLDVFPIVRGEWFDGNALSRFATSLPAQSFNQIFGPNGQLEMIPVDLLVGRGMKVSIFADSQSLDYLYEHFQAGADAGFFVGYFRIGGNGSYSTTHENIKVYKFADHLEFDDLSGRPQVLAMLAKRYGADKPNLEMMARVSRRADGKIRAQAIEELHKSWTSSAAFTPFAQSLSPEEREAILKK